MSQILDTSNPDSCIGDKIEAMSRSVAEISTLSITKPMETLKKIQQDRQDMQFSVQHEQKATLKQLSSMEQRLLAVDRQNIMKVASCGQSEAGLMEMIKDVQEEFRQKRQCQQQVQRQIRSSITNLKVGLAQKQQESSEMIEEQERQMNLKVENIDKGVNKLREYNLFNISNSMQSQFKGLKKTIDQEKYEREARERETERAMKDLKRLIQNRCEQEQLKQKDAFQRSYSALEEVFSLLSSRFGLPH